MKKFWYRELFYRCRQSGSLTVRNEHN